MLDSSEAFAIKAHQLQDRGVEVSHMGRIVDAIQADLMRRAVDDIVLHAAWIVRRRK